MVTFIFMVDFQNPMSALSQRVMVG